MKVVIVGGVAGGASAAARIRRLDEHAQIIMIERSGYVSYANCGLTRNLYRKVLPVLKLIPNSLHQEYKMVKASRLTLAKLCICQNHFAKTLFTLPFLP